MHWFFRFYGLYCFLLFASNVAEAEPLVVVSPDGAQHGTGFLHVPAEHEGMGRTTVTLADCDNLPESFDLRELGVVPEIRDQGSCGSCWAFSKTAALESAVKAGGGAMLDLSEQELVSNDRQNGGCGGGNLQSKEYQTTHGQGLEKDFPYTGRNSPAKTIPVAAKSTSWVDVPSYDEKQLKCALYKSHTIPWITASANNWGSFPSTEDQAHTSCRNGQTNHAIGSVGWRVISGKTYFIMRNSWGKSWGANGYGNIALNCDRYGEEISYPLTDTMPCKPPTPKLPVEVTGAVGDELVLAVKAQDGVAYAWTKDGAAVSGASATLPVVVAAVPAVYKVIAKNECGTGESQTRVKALGGLK